MLENAFMLFQRIGIFTALPLRSLDRSSLQNKLQESGGLPRMAPHEQEQI